jgi:hypothetical protein
VPSRCIVAGTEEAFGMLEYLKALASRILRVPFHERFPPPPPPEDPYAGVREPRRRGPGGRSAAVAVAEPRDDAESQV